MKRIREIVKVYNKSRPKPIPGNFRGKDDLFFKLVRDGFIKFLASPFKKRR